MKSIRHILILIALIISFPSCQEEDISVGSRNLVYSNMLATSDRDHDGVPDSSDNCPDDPANPAVDLDRDGCIDRVTHSIATTFAHVVRRPKNCEIPTDCFPNIGEIIISLNKPGKLAEFRAEVYNPDGKYIGSSTKKHKGAAKLLDDRSAILVVGIINDKFKSSPMKVIVTLTFALDGKMCTDSGVFNFKPEDFK